MRRFLAVLCVLTVSGVFGQGSADLRYTVQPGCPYRMSELATDSAGELLATSDSSWYPTYYNGNRTPCRGIWIAKGSASCQIMVHPLNRSDTAARWPIYIDSTLDAGYFIPFLFDKVFRTGSTALWDSVGYEPILNFKNSSGTYLER